MNARHAAALTLVGWYLMLPPIPGGKLDETAPLSRWEIQNTYGTQTDCQSSLSLIVTEALAELQTPMADEKKQLIRRSSFGTCVAEDDPLLKSK
jgi:hypothetical protein